MNRAVVLRVTPKFTNCSPAYLQYTYLQYPSGKGFILLNNKHVEVAFFQPEPLVSGIKETDTLGGTSKY